MIHNLLSAAFVAGCCISAAVGAAVTPTVVYQFNSSVTPENLILRPNGQLLVVANTENVVYQLDPNLDGTQTPLIVHTFPKVNGVFGLVEIAPDVYATAAGNYSLMPHPNTWSIWTLDLTAYQAGAYKPSNVKVKQVITPVPQVTNFDGLVVLNASAGLLAACDVFAGAIFTLDICNNKVTTLASGSQLTGRPGPGFSPAGINGLKIWGNKLYYTVTGQDYLGVISVNRATGKAASPLTTVFNYTIHLDDFNIAPSGNFYLTTLDTYPGGGIYKRAAGTPIGQNGTTYALDLFGTNAVVFQKSTSTSCTLIISAALDNAIFKAVLPESC